MVNSKPQGRIGADTLSPAKSVRDLDLAARTLSSWLTERSVAGERAKIDSLRAPKANGASNDIYLCDVLWTSGSVSRMEELVLRVTPSTRRIFPQYTLERDFRLLQFLSDSSSAPAPRPRWIETDPAVLGGMFYFMDRADGRAPPDTSSYHAEGWFAEETPERRASIWLAGIEAMAEVHKVTPEHLGSDFFRSSAQRPGLASQLTYYRRFYDWACRGDPCAVVTNAFAWLAEHRPRDEDVRLSWGDARFGNTLIDDTGGVTLLDWEMADFGDPAMDVSFWLMADYAAAAALGVPRLPGVPDAEETIAHYEACSGRRLQNFHYYELFSLIRANCIIARILCLREEQNASSGGETLHDNIMTRRLLEVMRRPANCETAGMSAERI